MSYYYLKMITFILHIVIVFLGSYYIRYFYKKMTKEDSPDKKQILLMVNKEHIAIIIFLSILIIINLIYIFNFHELIPIYYYKITPLIIIISFMPLLNFVSKK